MNPFEMVVIIVALGILGGVVKQYFDSRGNMEESSKARQRMENHIDALEERIRVLERIVTDNDYDLKQQFRDLDRDS